MEPLTANQIFNEALELEPQARPGFLERACAGDKSLRVEVDSLLDVYDRNPLPTIVPNRELPPATVGRYPILGELGRGGMGRVYLAEDPALGRRVALKVLPSTLFHAPEQFARFKREARILARLNHPNVATLYSLEQDEGAPFLTMELVTGETLASRLAALPAGSGLGVVETLKLAVDLSRALEAAHALGIVHRDLKPANVALTPTGAVKVLDFGLAKVIEAQSEAEAMTGYPVSSITTSGWHGDTLPGAMLGSPGYMSPEQIQGRDIGPASDLWSLGCIVFECLAGRPAFPGKTVVDRIAATLETEPDWEALPSRTPAALRRFLGKCLMRDPAERISSAAAARGEIERLAADAGAIAEAPAGQRLRASAARALAGKWGWVWWLAIAGTAAAMIWIVTRATMRPHGNATPERPVRQLTFTGRVYAFELSPDDQTVAYSTQTGALTLLDLGTGAETVLYRAERIGQPHWSPDGSEILFAALDSLRNERSYVVRREGGAAGTIGPIRCRALCWTPDGREVMTATWNQVGDSTRALLINPANGDTSSWSSPYPVFGLDGLSYAPDGHVAVWARDGAAYLTSRPDAPGHRILQGEPLIGCPQWSPDGKILTYVTRRDGTATLQEIAVDPRSGEPAGPARVLAQFRGSLTASKFHHGGQILYSSSQVFGALWMLDRAESGAWTSRSLFSGTASLSWPRLSPDGHWIAVSRFLQGAFLKGGYTVGLLPTSGGSFRNLSPPGLNARWPAWSPDGKEIAFQGINGSGSGVWTVDPSTGGTGKVSKQPCSGYVYWYPDTRIRYQTSESTRNYIFLEPQTGEETPMFGGPPRGTVFQSCVSPDHRRMAVAGNRGGFDEVKVWLIDLKDNSEHLLFNQAAAPIGWSGDGAWIYLARMRQLPESPGEVRAEVLRVSVHGGAAEPVVELPAGTLAFWSDADIAPDGKRIVAAFTQYGSDLWLAEEPGGGSSKQ